MNLFDRKLSCICTSLVLILVAMVGLTAALPAQAQTPPVIDGNLADMVTFVGQIQANATGCGLDIPDPEKDIAVIDPLIDPCPPIVASYFPNGFDQNRTLVGFFQGDLYLGIQTVGTVGDPDGDGTANNSCGADTNIPEEPGIGSADSYKWFLDTNCSTAFSPDVTITVSNNTLTVQGLNYNAGGSSFAFTGSGLEVKLDNVSLPGGPLVLFSARSFTGNTFDGLGEDLSSVLQCPPPDLSITIDKSVNPPAICPGTNTQVTLTVHNTSLVALDPVTVKDQMPAGFTYVAGSSNSGEPSIVGNELTFPNFALQPGAQKTITFNITAPSNCVGTVRNNASVSGRFSSECLPPPGFLDTTADDFADITCKALPCVDQVQCSGPPSACVGDPIRLCASARNCSTDLEDLTIVVDGTSHTFFDVPAGETREFCVDRTMPECVGGSASFNVTVNAENDCAKTPDVPCLITVNCGAEPCVDQVQCSGPPAACVGDPIRLCASGHNCSTGPEDITITVDGESHTFTAVPAGETREFCVDRTMPECVDGVAHFNSSVSASNGCGETPASPCQITIACNPEPCVDQVHGSGPPTACVGDEVRICGSARNCSTAPATLTITVDGESHAFTDVPAGETREFCVTRIMPSCAPGLDARSAKAAGGVQTAAEGGPVHCFQGSAKASNSCGETPETPFQVCVFCLPEPCVDQVQCSGPPAACVGDPIRLCATARNCSQGVEDLTITVDGESHTFTAVPPGLTREFCVDRTMPECVGGNATFDVNVKATNSCGETPDVPCTITVACKPEPCIDQVQGSGPTEAAEGDPLHLCITARNCSSGPETLTLVIDGTSQSFPAVPAGETREFCVDRTMPACESGQNVCFPASATATNDCGEIPVPIQICVECKVNNPACPRTIGFWRQQCAQKTGGSTKVCLQGMYNLWTCVLNETDVIQWKNNDGSFTKTSVLGALSQAQLFAFFCSQLQGPRPMTLRDMTEVQYLGLMLNVCSGNLPIGTQIDNGFSGTVGEAIDAIENALNTNTDLGKWEKVADDINNRLGVLATDCPGGENAIYANLPGCASAAPRDGNSLDSGDRGAAVPEVFMTRNYPNPVVDGSTSIYYTVPSQSGRANVEIVVFDAGGRLVKHLASGERDPGAYTVDWNLSDEGGNQVASGIYFYRVLVNGEKLTQKMLVIRR